VAGFQSRVRQERYEAKTHLRQWTQQALIFIAAYLGLDLYSGGGASAIGLYSNGDVELRWDNTSIRHRVFVWGAATLSCWPTERRRRRPQLRPGQSSRTVSISIRQLDFSKGRFGFDASAAAWYEHGLPAKNDNNSGCDIQPYFGAA